MARRTLQRASSKSSSAKMTTRILTAEWRKALSQSLSDPIQASFEEPSSPGSKPSLVSFSNMINEALRRSLPQPDASTANNHDLASSPKPELRTADIETMHRDSGIWGEDALLFKLLRWLDLSDEGWNASMPFGNRLFACPAKPEFGTRMIEILVAALAVLADHFSVEGWRIWLCRGCGYLEKYMDDEELLETDQWSYEFMDIVRR